jgi:hypothetical protein
MNFLKSIRVRSTQLIYGWHNSAAHKVRSPYGDELIDPIIPTVTDSGRRYL